MRGLCTAAALGTWSALVAGAPLSGDAPLDIEAVQSLNKLAYSLKTGTEIKDDKNLHKVAEIIRTRQTEPSGKQQPENDGHGNSRKLTHVDPQSPPGMITYVDWAKTHLSYGGDGELVCGDASVNPDYDECVLNKTATYFWTSESDYVDMLDLKLDFLRLQDCVTEEDASMDFDMGQAKLLWNNLDGVGPNTNECMHANAAGGRQQGCMYLSQVAEVVTAQTAVVGSGYKYYTDVEITIADADRVQCSHDYYTKARGIPTDVLGKDHPGYPFLYDAFDINKNGVSNGLLNINIQNGFTVPLNISLVPSCCANKECSLYLDDGLSLNSCSGVPITLSSGSSSEPDSIFAATSTQDLLLPGSFFCDVPLVEGANSQTRAYSCSSLNNHTARKFFLSFYDGLEVAMTVYDIDRGVTNSYEQICVDTYISALRIETAIWDDTKCRPAPGSVWDGNPSTLPVGTWHNRIEDARRFDNTNWFTIPETCDTDGYKKYKGVGIDAVDIAMEITVFKNPMEKMSLLTGLPINGSTSPAELALTFFYSEEACDALDVMKDAYDADKSDPLAVIWRTTYLKAQCDRALLNQSLALNRTQDYTQNETGLYKVFLQASAWGTGLDNPKDPKALTVTQTQKTLTFVWEVIDTYADQTSGNDGHFILTATNAQYYDSLKPCAPEKLDLAPGLQNWEAVWSSNCTGTGNRFDADGPGYNHSYEAVATGRNLLLGMYNQRVPCCDDAENAASCVWPTCASNYAVITAGDAAIAAHNIYKGIIIGGELSDCSPTAHGMVNSNTDGTAHPSHVGSFAEADWEKHWHFDSVVETSTPPTDCEFEKFVALSEKLVTTDSVKVFNECPSGPIDSSTFVGVDPITGAPQGEDNGATLVVYTCECKGTIILKGTEGSVAGRQFGPSLLAPCAKVIIDGSAGYVDGTIIAESLGCAGANADQVQLHGDLYKGPMECPCPDRAPQGRMSTAAVSPDKSKQEIVVSKQEDVPKHQSVHAKKKAEAAAALLSSTSYQKASHAEAAPTATSFVAAKRKLSIGAAALFLGGALVMMGAKLAMRKEIRARPAGHKYLPAVDETSVVEEDTMH